MSNSTEPLLSASCASARREVNNDDDNKCRSCRLPSRVRIRELLTSKFGHYFVLSLVTIDVASIMAEFIVRLFMCERSDSEAGWSRALKALGVTGLVFSSLFLAELLLSIWAIGRSYFKSYFHCFDALVIVTSFIIDVLLQGVLEAVASLVVVLRLWRVFKIIDELSAGADEQFLVLQTKIVHLEAENQSLLNRLRELEEQRSRS